MSDKEKPDIIGCLTAMIWLPCVLVLSAVLSGWALSLLWLWFAVNTFGLPVLSIPQAIGVSLIVNYMTYHHSNCVEKETPKSFYKVMLTTTGGIVARPLMALGFGWVVKSYFL